jgi:signal transduction histidine kinase
MLERRSGALVVVIEDDGRGFDVASALSAADPDQPHLGLFGMRERAALLGGRLTIESAPGQGTTIFVEIPIDHGQNPGAVGR